MSLPNLPPAFARIGDFIGVGGVISLLSYFLGAAFNGLTKADKDLISTLNRNLQERTEIEAVQSNKIAALTDELSRVQKIKRAEDLQMRELITVLQNRNPDLENILKEINLKLNTLMTRQG